MAIALIEISSNTKAVSGTSKDGRAYSFVKQTAYMHGGQAYPLPFELSVDPDKVIPAGLYALDGSVFALGNYGAIELRSREIVAGLVPVADAIRELQAKASKPLAAAA